MACSNADAEMLEILQNIFSRELCDNLRLAILQPLKLKQHDEFKNQACVTVLKHSLS